MQTTLIVDQSMITAIDIEKQPNEPIEENEAKCYEKWRLKGWFKRKLEAGDHIAATRKNGIYEHHGIYEGTQRGYPSVIHFQGPKTSLVKGAASLLCIFNCGYCHPKKGGIVISCIDCFSQRKKMFKMQYRLNKDLVSDQDPNWNHLQAGKIIKGYRNKKYYLEHYLEGELYGYSHVTRERLSDYILDDDTRFYDMSSEIKSKEVLDASHVFEFRPYKLFSNNCEHYAVFCKTGLFRSIQAESFPVPLSAIMRNMHVWQHFTAKKRT